MVIDVLTFDIAQNDTTICEGDQVELSLEYFGNSSYNLGDSVGGGYVGYFLTWRLRI